MKFEIERDMSKSYREIISGKPFWNRIVSENPLLGLAIIPENHFDIIEKMAQKVIKNALRYNTLSNIANIVVTLVIVNYAKNWDRIESSGFWTYIS